ncbi:GntR family transcriptional regulator [Streptomyces sp. NPDC102437]|uniref:GntR family transcriptional regulator n=1 Tax=Streptomyces sp. NPDC102437 TaxID=3366175 RepID=UPI00381F307A
MSTDQSATGRAYSAILDGILNGRYEPGTMLAEASLAAEIGVSRTPVRTALARLQDDGWITVYPKRGALVKGLSERAVADLADARLILESTSVQRADAADRQVLASRLEDSIEVQRETLARGDLRAFVESTIVFHRSFVEAGQNMVMLELNDRLADRQRFLLFSYGDTLLARCTDIITEHEALVHQLRGGDPAAFAESLRRHLGDTYGTSLRALCPDPSFRIQPTL